MTRSPSVIAPRSTKRAPLQSTSAVATAMSRSTVRSSAASSRVAAAPVARFLRLCLVKACANVPSNDNAWITFTAPIDSAAVAAIAPCCWRCRRALSRIRRLRRTVLSKNSGPVANANSANGALSQSITAAMPTNVSPLARSGRNAVTTTSCRNPTSPVTRTMRSPVRARV